MIKISAQAPTRIDLAGGTLDLWPLHQLLDHKATVNVAVTLPAQVQITTSNDGRFRFVSEDQGASLTGDFQAACQTKELPLLGHLLGALWNQQLPALTITTTAKSPAGAGLGGSSSLGIALAGALIQARQMLEKYTSFSEEALIQVVQDVEARLIHAPPGIQDYWAAVRGSINIIRFPPGRVEVQTLKEHHVWGLKDELILCYSGKSRQSAINNWEIFKRVFDKDLKLLSIFNEIGALAEQCAQAVHEGNLTKVLEFSEKEWELRTNLWPNIATTETRRLDQAARNAGARFSRVCGAGGGGVMAVFAPLSKHDAVKAALKAQGGFVLEAAIAHTGIHIEADTTSRH